MFDYRKQKLRAIAWHEQKTRIFKQPTNKESNLRRQERNWTTPTEPNIRIDGGKIGKQILNKTKLKTQ